MALGVVLLYGPRRKQFRMSEVPLYCNRDSAPSGTGRVEVFLPSCVPHHYILKSSNPITPRFRGLGFPKTPTPNPYSP